MATTCALLLALVMAASPYFTAASGHPSAGLIAPLRQARSVDGIAAVVDGETVSLGEVHRAALLRRAFGDAGEAGSCGFPTDGSAEARETPRGPLPAPAPLQAPTAELPSPLTPEELAAALECLIDSRLVFREVRRFPQLRPGKGDIESQYDALAESFGGERAFEEELQKQALTPEGVRRDLNRQYLVATYIDSRFRATIDVGDDQISSYYEAELVPDLTRQAIEIPPLDDVADLFIVPILREREVNRLVQSWISDLRERATIQRRLR